MRDTQRRFPELDLLRGLAVLSMVAYHICFDLAYFYGFDIPIGNMFFDAWAKVTATAFLFVMGICFMISWSRTNPNPNPNPKFLLRGLTIFSGGMIISLVTWFIAPDAFVKFGILHLIGISAIIQPLFVRFGALNMVIGSFWIIVGLKISSLTTNSPFLFPFGVVTSTFSSLDYYPLFPWFGIILIGMAAGSIFYIPRRHQILEQLDAFSFPRWILWTGRRALLLYFLHQPILLLILILLLGQV